MVSGSGPPRFPSGEGVAAGWRRRHVGFLAPGCLGGGGEGHLFSPVSARGWRRRSWWTAARRGREEARGGRRAARGLCGGVRHCACVEGGRRRLARGLVHLRSRVSDEARGRCGRAWGRAVGTRARVGVWVPWGAAWVRVRAGAPGGAELGARCSVLGAPALAAPPRGPVCGRTAGRGCWSGLGVGNTMWRAHVLAERKLGWARRVPCSLCHSLTGLDCSPSRRAERGRVFAPLN